MKLIIYIFGICLLWGGDAWGAGYQSIDSLPMATPSPKKRPPSNQGKSAATVSSVRNYVGKDGSVMLFGTVEIARPVETLPIWTDVLQRNAKEPIFLPEKYFNKTTTWKNLRDKATGKTPLQQLQLINEFWNKWTYKEDRVNWNKADYWAIPAQFLKKSGDCEDYSIIKYYTLKELGFDPQKMRIVVLRDTLTGQAHAVLAVYLENDVYILDNLSSVVLSHKRLAHYTPQYSVNEFKRWQHILPVNKKK